MRCIVNSNNGVATQCVCRCTLLWCSFYATTHAHWTIPYHWGIVCSAHLSKVNQQLRRSLLQPFLFFMLKYSSYFRLIRTGAGKQKAAIQSLRTVKPAVTVTILWPWNPLRVGTVREILIRLSLRSALQSSGPLLVLTRKKKWWELWFNTLFWIFLSVYSIFIK